MLRTLLIYNLMVAFNATYFLCTSAYIENEGGKELLDHEIKKYQVTLDIGKGVVFEEANCKGRIYSSSTIDNTIQRACNAKNQNLGSEISNESLRSFIPTAKGKDKPALTETSAPFYLLSLADTVFKDQSESFSISPKSIKILSGTEVARSLISFVVARSSSNG